jgi:hypothetical protein
MQNLRELMRIGRAKGLSLFRATASFAEPVAVLESPVADSATAIFPNREPEAVCRQSVIPNRYRKSPSVRKIDQVQSELESARAQCEALQLEYSGKQSQLFAIEQEARELLSRQFQPQIARLHEQIAQLEKEAAEHSINSQYQSVDIAFLKLLKDEDGAKLPRFVLFDATSDRFALALQQWKSLDHASPRVQPAEAAELFDHSGLCSFAIEFMETEQQKQNEAAKRRPESERWRGPATVRSVHVSIACQFGGRLSAAVRNAIATNKDGFDHYFIVLEAPEWIISCRNAAMPVYTTEGNVVLLGKKGKQYWLVKEVAEGAA